MNTPLVICGVTVLLVFVSWGWVVLQLLGRIYELLEAIEAKLPPAKE